MILLCGIPSESPIALVRERLVEMGVPHLVLSQRRFEEIAFHFEVSGGCVSGGLTLDGRTRDLDDFTAVYTRLMDDQSLPELAGESAGSPRRTRARALHDAVSQWYEVAPIRVVNRTAAMGSNGSKPFQAQAVTRRGLLTPETLITSDPELARAVGLVDPGEKTCLACHTESTPSLARFDHARKLPLIRHWEEDRPAPGGAAGKGR